MKINYRDPKVIAGAIAGGVVGAKIARGFGGGDSVGDGADGPGLTRTIVGFLIGAAAGAGLVENFDKIQEAMRKWGQGSGSPPASGGDSASPAPQTARAEQSPRAEGRAQEAFTPPPEEAPGLVKAYYAARADGADWALRVEVSYDGKAPTFTGDEKDLQSLREAAQAMAAEVARIEHGIEGDRSPVVIEQVDAEAARAAHPAQERLPATREPVATTLPVVIEQVDAEAARAALPAQERLPATREPFVRTLRPHPEMAQLVTAAYLLAKEQGADWAQRLSMNENGPFFSGAPEDVHCLENAAVALAREGSGPTPRELEPARGGTAVATTEEASTQSGLDVRRAPVPLGQGRSGGGAPGELVVVMGDVADGSRGERVQKAGGDKADAERRALAEELSNRQVAFKAKFPQMPGQRKELAVLAEAAAEQLGETANKVEKDSQNGAQPLFVPRNFEIPEHFRTSAQKVAEAALAGHVSDIEVHRIFHKGEGSLSLAEIALCQAALAMAATMLRGKPNLERYAELKAAVAAYENSAPPPAEFRPREGTAGVNEIFAMPEIPHRVTDAVNRLQIEVGDDSPRRRGVAERADRALEALAQRQSLMGTYGPLFPVELLTAMGEALGVPPIWVRGMATTERLTSQHVELLTSWLNLAKFALVDCERAPSAIRQQTLAYQHATSAMDAVIAYQGESASV